MTRTVPDIQTGDTSRPLSRTYAVLFLVAISVPAVRFATGGRDAGVERELRGSSGAPGLTADAASWSSFPRRFETWYANHFAFRSGLVRQHNYVKWFALASSPSDTIVRGRDGWVFYSGSDALEQVRGAIPFTEDDLEAWVRMLEERRSWAEAHGARYVLAIAPEKSRVYPEYMPPGYGPVGPSRVEQLAAALAERSGVTCVDLGPAVIAERLQDRAGDWTFFPYGTHWTRRGGARGWRRLIAAVPDVFDDPVPAEDTVTRVLLPGGQGDTWGSRLYLEDYLEQEEWLVRMPRAVVPEPLAYSKQGVRYDALDPGAPDRPRVILFHDSYGTAFRPFLARSCQSLICFWRFSWEVAVIERERPDLIIDLIVERKLVTFDPVHERLQTQDRVRAAFEAAGETLWSSAEETPLGVERRNPKRPGSSAADGDPVKRPRDCRLTRLPDLSAAAGETCLIALDVHNATGGVLEILLQGTEFRAKPMPLLRRDAPRAFAPPGRHTVYFERIVPREPSDVWICSDEDGWTLHGAEARRSPTTGR